MSKIKGKKGKTRVFSLPPDEQIDSFVEGTRAKNTEKSTAISISLLERYRDQTFQGSTDFRTMDETDIVDCEITQGFFCKQSSGRMEKAMNQAP